MHKAAKKPYKGLGMEGWLARWYTRTRGSDIEDFRQQAHAVAQRLGRGQVLEVAPGPGFFSIELARLGDFEITGLDISQTLVQIASAGTGRPASTSIFGSATRRRCPLPRRRSILSTARRPSKTFPSRWRPWTKCIGFCVPAARP